jgi:hypothetical protein
MRASGANQGGAGPGGSSVQTPFSHRLPPIHEQGPVWQRAPCSLHAEPTGGHRTGVSQVQLSGMGGGAAPPHEMG